MEIMERATRTGTGCGCVVRASFWIRKTAYGGAAGHFISENDVAMEVGFGMMR